VEFARSYVRGDRTRYYVERVVVRASWDADPATAEAGAAAPAHQRASHRSPRSTNAMNSTAPTPTTTASTG
ncbi:MAG: hypothetical protein QOE42_851, partial [Chloroflexota bacterium]|nr:hypothetical protein [Chloroflexota bacterium]